MQKFQDVVLDSQGRPVAGAVIAVLSYPGGSPATVYQTDAVGTAYTPTTDDYGAFYFYAPDGNYSYTVTVSGVLRKTVTDVQIVDAIDALALKAPAASPTFTGTVVLPTATSIGSVSSTEISYLDGVTSAIQTQLGTKPTVASGSWTPIDGSGAGLALTGSDGRYTKIGDECFISAVVVYPATVSGAQATIGGLPFNIPGAYATGGGMVMLVGTSINAWAYLTNGGDTIQFYKQGTTTKVTNAELSGQLVTLKFSYPTT